MDFTIDLVAIYVIIIGVIYFSLGGKAAVIASVAVLVAAALFLCIFKPWIKKD